MKSREEDAKTSRVASSTRPSTFQPFNPARFTIAYRNQFANMADGVANGDPITTTADVEMKEEDVPSTETPIQAIPDQPPLSTSITEGNAAPPAVEVVATPPAPSTSAAATRPGSMPPQPSAKPDQPVAHGGPTRQYLNQNVTPHLLEAMKHLAANEPKKPLLWLSEFLRDRSKEVEG